MSSFIPSSISTDPAGVNEAVNAVRSQSSNFIIRSWCYLTTEVLGSTILGGPQFDSSQGSRLKSSFPSDINLLTATIQDLQAYLSNGSITSVELTKKYLTRIEANNFAGLNLRAVVETAPYEHVIGIAQYYDDLRAKGTVLSELHGIPLLIKDNIATDVELDATVISKLRSKGAIVLGKASMTEFANFRGSIENGWGARHGQCQSAYVVGGFDAGGDPSGSSSGSAVAISAGFAAGTLGSETDGSIIDPAGRAAAYGIKPSIGLVSRSGVIPISSSQDTVGPIVRSTYDAALLLTHLAGYDAADPATHDVAEHVHHDYTQFTKPSYATFKGKKLGIPSDDESKAQKAQDAFNRAVSKIESLGAIIQDPAEIPSMDEWLASDAEWVVMTTEFKEGIATYLKDMTSSDVRTLEDIINFNDTHPVRRTLKLCFDLEFPPGQRGQQTFITSLQTAGTESQPYLDAVKTSGFRLLCD
ncbi:hypothetical protein QFC19_005349 [Naganishia cerealis]|uniref:Uncharacterized protein n=1 Tax=Naganishia cerealis TaxID=610337 RepID=A0ACC2VPD8_9TREE|nr:hypothetical protein QFC19_005349 [Naganishia cerealis]